MENFQHQFWRTKSAILKSFGSKSDAAFCELSDTELDLKLEQFRSLVSTCHRLADICKYFNETTQNLIRSENGFASFLKETITYENNDLICDVLQISSFAFENCGNQRLLTKGSMERFHHDLDVFRTRAITDCQQTIREMEKLRLEYYGALNWMKSESKKLDPDSMNLMHQFRKVQNQVRQSKIAFDRSKLVTMQKIDLLIAARLNLFSHCLAAYQKDLFRFAETVFEIFANAFLKLTQFQSSKIEKKETKRTATICKNKEPIIEEELQLNNQLLLDDLSPLTNQYLPSNLIDGDGEQLQEQQLDYNNVESGVDESANSNFNARLAWLRSFRDFDPLQNDNNNKFDDDSRSSLAVVRKL